jgi:hypothetical protein
MLNWGKKLYNIIFYKNFLFLPFLIPVYNLSLFFGEHRWDLFKGIVPRCFYWCRWIDNNFLRLIYFIRF